MIKTDASRVHFLYAIRWVGVLLIVLWTVLFGLRAHRADAATSTTINFQARLMQSSGAIVPDGTYNVEFKMYNALTSSGSSQGSCTGDTNCLWTETRTSTNKITVVNGYLTAELGSVTSLPSIDWSQNLYLTMNIGGTGTASWDGEMSPRLHLTAVPHAFSADKLTATNGSNTSTLSFTTPTASRSILLPDEAGTLCIQASTNCGFAASTGSGSYIQNGVTAQSANMYVQAAASGSVAGVLRANVAGTGDILDLKNGAGTNVATFGSTGAVLLQNSTNSASAFQIQNAAGSSIFNINTSTGLVTQSGGLRLNVSTSTVDTFTTPLGSSVPTAINIPLYNPGAFGQLLAFGLPSTAPDTARAISVFDARTSGTIQPAIAVFSPNENDVFGLSWNGLNTVASLETTSAAIALRPGGSNVKLWAGSTGVAIGNNVSSAGYPLDVTGDINTSTQYRIAGTVICTSTGCTPAAGSANYIQNTTTAQSANMYVQAATSGSVAATLRANAAGTGDILDLKNGAGTNVATVSSTGAVLFENSTNSTTAFQVQNAAAGSVFNVDTTNSRVGIGIAAPAVSLDVEGGIQQTGLATSNTNGTDDNKWTLMGTCTITAQYRQCLSTVNIIGGHDGTAGDNPQATISMRIKQQNAMAGAPYITVTMNNTAEFITKNDIATVTTQNDATATVVKLYGRITNTYEQWFFTPTLNPDYGSSKWVWSESAGFLTTLPAGTQTPTVYGDAYANTMTVQTATNSTTAFQVQNAAGARAMSVDTANLRVAVGGTFNPQEALDVVGNLQVKDAATSTKSYRLRTSGGGLDLEGAGANLVLSIWSAAGYTGTQYNQITFKNDGSSMDFARGFNVSSATAKVGLGGNTAPGYPLDVTGDINTSTALRIAGTSVCDTTGGTGCIAKSGSGFYIHNDTALQTTANFNISGTGIAATALQAPIVDASSASTLSIGTVNATGVNIASNNVAHTIHIADGGTSTIQTVTMGSTFSTSATLIQGGTGTSAISLTAGSGGNIKLTTASTGSINLTPGASGVFIRPTTDSTAAMQVISNTSGNSVLRVDTTNERVAIGVITDPIGAKLSIATSSTVSLRAYQGGSSDSFQLGNATDDFLTISSTGNFLMKPTTNSANAFRIQNSGGAATLFTVDTSGNNIQIGSSTTDTTAILLTLDSYSTTSDPTGIAGAMYYSTAYNAMRCYEDGAWSNCNDPTRMSHGYNIQEEFLGATNGSYAINCGSTDNLSAEYAWDCYDGGTATTGSAVVTSSDTYQRPGQVKLSTGISASGAQSIYLSGGTTASAFIVGGGEVFETAINIPTLSTSTQEYAIRVGLCVDNDHAAPTCGNGVYFEYNRTNSTSWRGRTVQNYGTATQTSTTKAVVAGWTNLKFVVTSANSATFYVKGPGETSYTNIGSVGSATTMPNAAAYASSLMLYIDKSVGTTARTFNVDYVDYYNDFQGTR
jgi:hypothetical protein